MAGKTFDRELAVRSARNAALKIREDGKAVLYLGMPGGAFQEFLEFQMPFSLSQFNIACEPGRDFAVNHILLRSPDALEESSWEDYYAAPESLESFPGKAENMASRTFVPSSENGMYGVTFRPSSEAGNAEMVLTFEDGSEEKYSFSVESVKHQLMADVGAYKKGDTVELADALIRIGGTQPGNPIDYYVKPKMQRFHSSYSVAPGYYELIDGWNELPGAANHPLSVTFRTRPDHSLEMYLDGNWVQLIEKPCARIEFHFKNNTLSSEYRGPSGENCYTFLDLSLNPRADSFADAKLNLKEGFQTLENIPVLAASPLHSADIGICRSGMGDWNLEVEEYLGRTPLDGFPCAVHFVLPCAPYVKAYVLFALDPDPAKEAVLTTRIGKFIQMGSGGNMMNQEVLRMPANGELPENVWKIGTVEKDGAELPLYLACIDLGLGKVLDMASHYDCIDFEFYGASDINYEQIDRTMKPDNHVSSSFQIFGVTLEKSPVVMDMIQVQPGNVFYADEKAETGVSLKAFRPAEGMVEWTASDVDGKTVFTGSSSYDFKEAGMEGEIVIPLDAGTGFYELEIVLKDKSGISIRHPARFVIVPEDQRLTESLESPFATWWFGAVHGSDGNLDRAGVLMQKAGIRKVGWGAPKKEERGKYQLHDTLCGFFPLSQRDIDPETGKFKPKKIQDPENPDREIEISGEEYAVRQIRKALEANPDLNTIYVWHESAPGCGGIPEELLNMEVPELTESQKLYGPFITEAGRIVHQFPGLKMQIGNSSASIGAVTVPLRAGADPEAYDYIGIETPSQVVIPEKLQEVGLQGMMISKDIAQILAGRPIKANGCWEFVYRCERDMGEQQQAEWYMRDVLISLANDFSLISPGTFFDCSSGYYNTLWGGSGILKRKPYGYPKRAYAAYAVITNVMDGVKFKRQIPTGSTTVYAVEFVRKDGQFATGLWTSRGTADFNLHFAGDAQVRVIDMYGREKELSGTTVTVQAGTAPVYLVTDQEIVSIDLSGRAFPKDEFRSRNAGIAWTWTSMENIAVQADPGMETKHHRFLPILKPGNFTVKPVKDEEVGDCLEVSLNLDSDPYRSKYITEYTTLRFKEPVPVPGNPVGLGVLIKGNSSWGTVRFEIEDAQGEIFRSQSTSGWGCDIFDWQGNLSLNFDGWNTVSHPLFPSALFNDKGPGPVSEQWVSEGGDKEIDLPVKIRAVTIGINRWKLDLLDFKESSPSVRIKAVMGVEEEPR